MSSQIHADPPVLELSNGDALLPSFVANGDPALHQHIEASDDLVNWQPVASSFSQAQWTWQDDFATLQDPRFYRLSQNASVVPAGTASLVPSGLVDPNWVRLVSEGFETLSPEDQLFSRKFIVVLDDLPNVYFLPPGRDQFHYAYVTQHLTGFTGISPEEYTRLSTPGPEVQLISGSLFYFFRRAELGVSINGAESLSAEVLAHLVNAVTQTVEVSHLGDGSLPANETLLFAEGLSSSFSTSDISALNRRNVVIDSLSRWLVSSVCYSPGWAIGRLKILSGDQVEAAFLSGEILPGDILVLDSVPEELPPVAGVLLRAPANEGAHAVIQARSTGVPMAALPGDQLLEEIPILEGQTVLLNVIDGDSGCEIDLVPTADFSAEALQLLAARKAPPVLAIQPVQRFGTISVGDLAPLTAASIQHVGGKAANFRLLRRAIPDQAPEAIAFTFDLWIDYLAQTLPGGDSLQEKIDQQLAGFSWPPDMATLEPALAEVRRLIKEEADFSPEQRSQILQAVAHFPTDQRLRFRSSTNVEDSAHFTGAGLYDSFSGCVADDTDGDDAGPSHCDPLKSKERGVFRAMRKVYASFYNTNAYLERLRFSLDESTVGMAILVHRSFPDEIEAANGVALYQKNNDERWHQGVTGSLVTQPGALSVTNPTTDTRPEVVSFSKDEGVVIEEFAGSQSERTPVMTWKSDYEALITSLHAVADEFEDEAMVEPPYTLDFEYKKLADDRLVIKQVRQIPQNSSAGLPFVIGDSANFIVFLDGFGNSFGESTVFSRHRLKPTLRFSTQSEILSPDRLEESPFYAIDLQILEDGEWKQYIGNPSEFTDAEYTFDSLRQVSVSTWTSQVSGQTITYQLRVGIPRSREVIQARSFDVSLRVQYEEPLISTDQAIFYERAPLTTTDFDFVQFVTESKAPPQDVGAAKVRQVTTESGITIETRYYSTPLGEGLPPDYIAAFQGWISTSITGLTTEPIILTDDFSRSYWASRHNLVEYFLFDPHRSTGVTEQQKQELLNAGVDQILLNYGNEVDWISSGSISPEVFLISPEGNPTNQVVEEHSSDFIN